MLLGYGGRSDGESACLRGLGKHCDARGRVGADSARSAKRERYGKRTVCQEDRAANGVAGQRTETWPAEKSWWTEKQIRPGFRVLAFPPLGDLNMSADEFDTDETVEWFHSELLSGRDIDGLIEVIESALDSVFTGVPVISESDIDGSIADNLELLREDYEQGEVSEEEWERELSEVTDRDLMRKELIEADAGGHLRDGYAASELIVALLGKRTLALEHALDAYGQEFEAAMNGYRGEVSSGNELVSLIPKALAVVDKLREQESIKLLGFVQSRQKRVWIKGLDELEANLKEEMQGKKEPSKS